MIIANLIGGLGNQMFQYATARSLSLKKNTTLQLDISSFENYPLHQGFELDRVFDISTKISSESDVKKILGWNHTRMFRRFIFRFKLFFLKSQGLIFEPHFNFWPDLFNVPNNSYLVGYWQTEKYFNEYSEIIHSDFTFRRPLDSVNIDIATNMNLSNSVSLHIRRGDYVNNPKTKSTHGLCSLDYYSTAVNYISNHINSPHFFIFSDDITWAKENIKLDFPCQFIGHNHGINSYIDMQLMSKCKHNVIANSSFSWWGAWLNQNKNKIVIAPKQWFADNTKLIDIIPPNWIKL